MCGRDRVHTRVRADGQVEKKAWRHGRPTDTVVTPEPGFSKKGLPFLLFFSFLMIYINFCTVSGKT